MFKTFDTFDVLVLFLFRSLVDILQPPLQTHQTFYQTEIQIQQLILMWEILSAQEDKICIHKWQCNVRVFIIIIANDEMSRFKTTCLIHFQIWKWWKSGHQLLKHACCVTWNKIWKFWKANHNNVKFGNKHVNVVEKKYYIEAPK